MKKLENLKGLDSTEWVEILKNRPELAEFCDRADEFKTWEWVDLLRLHPELEQLADNATTYGALVELNPEEWAEILAVQPQLFENIKYFANDDFFTKSDWDFVTEKQPSLMGLVTSFEQP